jgi:hypothetical protein
LAEYAKDYNKSMVNLQNLPRVFNPGNIQAFCTTIFSDFGDIFDDVTLHKIISYKAFALWNAGQFSGKDKYRKIKS